MDDDLTKWVEKWAAVEEKLAKDRPPTPAPQKTSFFNGMPSSLDYVDNTEPTDDWHKIYHRAMEIDFTKGDNIINDSTVNVAYMGSEGYGKQNVLGTTATGGKKVYTQNPINFASVGVDQEDADGHVRVTKNWSDGEDLRELDEIKKKVESMERKFHASDVTKKPDRTKVESELKNLRDRVKTLSEKLTSQPQQDLA